IRLLLTRADHERPEHIVRLAFERRARHHGRAVATAGGGERGPETKWREWSGLWRASAGDGRAQQKKRELQLHRRDFFFAAFFLTSAFGFTARTGLDVEGPLKSKPVRAVKPKALVKKK